MAKKIYRFQESKIWEGSNDVIDPNGKRFKTRAGDLKKVKLPPNSSVGRYWILISIDGVPVKD